MGRCIKLVLNHVSMINPELTADWRLYETDRPSHQHHSTVTLSRKSLYGVAQ